MNVKKTKKFKENRPENYHVHDKDRGSFAKNLQRTPRERGSEGVAATPADKEELRQTRRSSGKDWRTLEKTGELWRRLGNSAEDCEAPQKSGKLCGSLGSSAEVWEAPGTKNFKGEHRKGIAKASRRRDNCRETGRAVGKLASLSRTEGTSVVDFPPHSVQGGPMPL